MFSERLAELFLSVEHPAKADVTHADLPDSAAKNVALACQYMLVLRKELHEKEDGHKLFLQLANQAYQLLEDEVQKAFAHLENGSDSGDLDQFIKLLDGSLEMERDCDFNNLPYEHRLLALTTTARYILKYGLRELSTQELAEMVEDLNQNMLGIEMEAQMFAPAPTQGEELPVKTYLTRLHSVVVVGLKEELQNLKQAGL